MRVNEINFSVGKSKSHIFLFSDTSEMKLKNSFSILIGKNGTFKSTTLKNLANFFRGSSSAKCVVVADGTPSKVIAISSSLGDKFSVPNYFISSSAQVQNTKKHSNYFYFGPRTRNGYSNLAQVRQLMSALEHVSKSQDAQPTIEHIFKEIGFLPSIEFVFENSRNFSEMNNKDTRKSIGDFIEREIQYNEMIFRRLDNILSRLEIDDPSKFRYIWNLNRDESNYSDFLTMINLLIAKKKIRVSDLRLFRADQTSFSINDLSSGESSLLLKFLSLACVIENDSLVLIDEPENSLHPNWQITFLEQLKKTTSSLKGCHIVIATHSPHILSSFSTENGSVIALKCDKDNIIGNPIDYSTYGWSVEKILLDIFDVATTRNFYFETKLRTLLKEIRGSSPSGERISKLVHELEGFAQDENDPLTNLLNEARKYM